MKNIKNKNKLKLLANLIFPDVYNDIEKLEKKYPTRSLQLNAEVTRFAPSPTGFLHTGSLFTALISFLIAKNTNGIFYLRLEDTDSKRKIINSDTLILKELKKFNIIPNEDFNIGGKYAPYKQSERKEIYKTVIKHLISNDLAYPCFCSQKELDEIREIQKKNKQITGYYGNYAKCRYLTIEEIIKNIKNKKPYVIRFKSNGNHNKKINLFDEIRGNINISENDIDVIILKSDSLPTYHLAHVVDDHFMRTTLVIRGEEWLSSFPIHYDLFNSLKWKMPKYIHLPLISKLENNKKRKLSKRKDPEAATSYFLEKGYPAESVIIYLMSIIDSNFETWIIKNNFSNFFNFPFIIKKINLDGALFDLKKLDFFSREFLATLDANDIANRALQYANQYDNKLKKIILKDFNYFVKIMNIERKKEKPRKDYTKFSDIYDKIIFFYDDDLKINHNILLNFSHIDKNKIIELLKSFINLNNYSLNEKEWFETLKLLGIHYNFASSIKEFNNNKEFFSGSIIDVTNLIRVALTGNIKSPNLYDILQILKKERVDKRIKKFINFVKKNY